MAKVKKKDKDVSKWKKKKWFPIIAPKMFDNTVLGETVTFDSSEVVGKAVMVNLMNLTGEVKNQNVNVRFKVRNVVEGKGQTEVIGYTLSPSFIKRVVRRRHSRVDARYKIKTKDNKELIIKPLVITRNKANRSEVGALKSTVLETLHAAAESSNYDDFIKNIMHYRFQLDMRKKLSKIFPVKTFEIKKMDLVEKEI